MKNKSIKKVKNSKFGKPNKFDINGSYTGTSSLIADLKPIQDADDLYSNRCLILDKNPIYDIIQIGEIYGQ
ncbi:MAG: hypothetical protein J6Q15_00740 [Clostridia bacterium]|nr:hypothetical protein [Clostridia bacterium]